MKYTKGQLTGSLPDDVVVSVSNVSKKFCKSLRRSMAYGILDLARNMMGVPTENKTLRRDEFWALENVSFELKRGEALGLLGVNGSGKTTLLRLLAGIFPPDAGEISVRSRIGALIAVGAGFHPLMSGRENIYLNAAILGLHSARIDEKFDDIVDFAGIGDFLDAPVSTYSSGMRVRLGFSIATAMDPDILLLDEILAVGDAQFRAKCYNRIGRICSKAAVIFVSHNVAHVAQVCNKCVCLKKGRVAYVGSVDKGIECYLQDNDNDKVEDDSFECIEPPVRSATAELIPEHTEYGGTIELNLTIETSGAIPDATLRIPLYDRNSVVVAEWNSKALGQRMDLKQGINRLTARLGPLYLKKGAYKTGIVLNDSSGVALPYWSFKKHAVSVDGPIEGGPAYQLPDGNKQP